MGFAKQTPKVVVLGQVAPPVVRIGHMVASGSNGEPQSTRRVIQWFVRGMGLVYLSGFVSLGVQLDGLYGSGGILPAAEYLNYLERSLGWERFFRVPTLLWLSRSDVALFGLWSSGAGAAFCLFLGVVPKLSATICWALYLSLFAVGRVFLGFQWDTLLLEAGFLTVLVSPAVWRFRGSAEFAATEAAGSPVAWWLVRWLLFRLMFASGVVKLLSGDPNWPNLSALDFHYFTQPLPPWTAWYAHQLPAWFDQLSVGIMFAIELVLPFAAFGPRRVRLLAFMPLLALQLAIIATGNYGFFNWLTCLLCLSLLDDRAIPRAFGHVETATPSSGFAEMAVASRVRRAAMVVLAAVLVTTSTTQMLGRFGLADSIPWPASRLSEALSPLRLTSSYGLFSYMTRTRPEIVIEGSRDGDVWLAYEFIWKPGDIDRRPSFVAPHQPRLDWQMWFAALSDYRRQGWIMNLQRRLLEGAPQVTGLLETNPFADEPPRYIRAMLWDYRFTERGGPVSEGIDGSRQRGIWWSRRFLRQYSPTLERR